MLRQPARGGVAVLGCRRERVLRRKPVVDGDDEAADAVREAPADAVVRVEVADDPPAAVEVHEHGERCSADRRVDADRDLARGSRDGSVLDPRDGLGLTGESHHAEDQLAGLGDGHLVELRPSHARKLVEDGFGLRIERHRTPPSVRPRAGLPVT